MVSTLAMAYTVYRLRSLTEAAHALDDNEGCVSLENVRGSRRPEVHLCQFFWSSTGFP